MIDWWYQIAETNHHRRNAAQAELEAVEKEYQVGRMPVDMLLRSRAQHRRGRGRLLTMP